MRLDLDLQKTVIRWAKGEGPKLSRTEAKTFYRYFSNRAEEKQKVARLKRCLSEPDEAFLSHYFVRLRPLIPSLPSSLQYFFRKCYPQLDWARLSATGG